MDDPAASEMFSGEVNGVGGHFEGRSSCRTRDKAFLAPIGSVHSPFMCGMQRTALFSLFRASVCVKLSHCYAATWGVP